MLDILLDAIVDPFVYIANLLSPFELRVWESTHEGQVWIRQADGTFKSQDKNHKQERVFKFHTLNGFRRFLLDHPQIEVTRGLGLCPWELKLARATDYEVHQSQNIKAVTRPAVWRLELTTRFLGGYACDMFEGGSKIYRQVGHNLSVFTFATEADLYDFLRSTYPRAEFLPEEYQSSDKNMLRAYLDTIGH